MVQKNLTLQTTINTLQQEKAELQKQLATEKEKSSKLPKLIALCKDLKQVPPIIALL
jgi:hypothetical protein